MNALLFKLVFLMSYYKIIQDMIEDNREVIYLALDLQQNSSGPHQVFLHGYLSETNAKYKTNCKVKGIHKTGSRLCSTVLEQMSYIIQLHN